uniref:Phospholipid scramblase n=1 Tax=Odontella aurita TaxID=265563 RepID=A0A7S4NES8_9STRA|mmetsp:Transcript_62062/g.183388  ORF Transcript_62062/g.183388 Transcript_62062/m.183388 type:complete len:304 (+) Transcript_62062:82-993(+)
MAENESSKAEARPELTTDLTSISGVVIHQSAQPGEAISQAFGIPFEAKNKYVVSAIPDGASVVSSSSDAKLWQPSLEDIKSLPELFIAKEDSDCFTRVLFTFCGCRALRPMEIRIKELGRDTSTYMHKPFKCGGPLCCPLEMQVANEGGGNIGSVKENFDPYCSKCFECCCTCTVYHNVYPSSTPVAPSTKSMERDGELGEPKYELKFNTCCCGDNNNFCGATCFNHNSFFQIRDPSSEKVVGNIQKLFAPSSDSGCSGVLRCCFGYDTFAITFPEGSSHEDRMTLIAGIMQAEFQIWEKDQD